MSKEPIYERSDIGRVLAAMKMVAAHRLRYLNALDEELEVLAETAVKTMWLIEEENEQ